MPGVLQRDHRNSSAHPPPAPPARKPFQPIDANTHLVGGTTQVVDTSSTSLHAPRALASQRTTRWRRPQPTRSITIVEALKQAHSQETQEYSMRSEFY